MLMEREIVYNTQGTCSRQIIIGLDDRDVVTRVQFVGGCMGNTQGVASLAKGMTAQEVISRLEGIMCGSKGTSCPDQLARALRAEISK